MIVNLALMAALGCPNYTITNRTNTWTAQDQTALDYVITRGCAAQYKNSPCLKSFEKVEEGNYNVLCTQQIKK